MAEDIFRGRRCLVTGASSGLGEQFARQLAAAGASLVLVARSTDKLERLAVELREAHQTEVRVETCDLAQAGERVELLARLRSDGRDIEHLVNNAGLGDAEAFVDSESSKQLQMVRLNCEALVDLTRAFVPEMRRLGRGGVLQVASMVAFMPIPGMAVYGASKAFVLSFTEALAEELNGSGVRMMALCPGASPTAFRAAAGISDTAPPGELSAERIVRDALSAYARGRRTFTPGALNALNVGASKLVPRRALTKMVKVVMQQLDR